MLILAADTIKVFAVGLFSTVIGWWMLVSAGIRLAKWSDPRRNYGAPSVLARAIVGSLFIESASYLNSVTMTLTGMGMPDVNAMSVMPDNVGGGPTAMMFGAGLAWLAALGVLAIFNGTRLLIKGADGAGQGSSEQDPIWTGCIYIVSGAIGVNIWRFVGGLL